jgi:hypothetical protein
MRNDIVKFSYNIEAMVQSMGISYMEAVLEYCEKFNIEIEVAAKLLSPALKSKIEHEAKSMNSLPKTDVKKLPL